MNKTWQLPRGTAVRLSVPQVVSCVTDVCFCSSRHDYNLDRNLSRLSSVTSPSSTAICYDKNESCSRSLKRESGTKYKQQTILHGTPNEVSATNTVTERTYWDGFIPGSALNPHDIRRCFCSHQPRSASLNTKAIRWGVAHFCDFTHKVCLAPREKILAPSSNSLRRISTNSRSTLMDPYATQYTETTPEAESPHTIDIASILVTDSRRSSTIITPVTLDVSSKELMSIGQTANDENNTISCASFRDVNLSPHETLARQCNVIRIPSPHEIDSLDDAVHDGNVVKKKGRKKSASKSLSSSAKHRESTEQKSRGVKHVKKSARSSKKRARKRASLGEEGAETPSVPVESPILGENAMDDVATTTAISPSEAAISGATPKMPDLPAVNELPNTLRAPRVKNSRHISNKPSAKHSDQSSESNHHDIGAFYDFHGLDDASAQTINQIIRASADKAQSWQGVPMSLSQGASRFELPIDMQILENISAQDYLRRYVTVSPKRKYLYDGVFSKLKNAQGCVPYEDLGAGLRDVLVGAVSDEWITKIVTLLDINKDTSIDLKLFSGVAAFTERLLYAECATEETKESRHGQQQMIECADFCALRWKCNGVHVNPNIKEIWESLLVTEVFTHHHEPCGGIK